MYCLLRNNYICKTKSTVLRMRQCGRNLRICKKNRSKKTGIQKLSINLHSKEMCSGQGDKFEKTVLFIQQ